ncbi:MAG: nitronate monooxygenase [bacterium]|jgi:nitronate monooxygenase|nr:nitronate monooxygenase [bacterium]
MTEPIIIQGGMGAGVSNWTLANAVSRLGQLGVVSGTALDAVVARRLQDGDPGGHIKDALDHFPIPDIAQRIYNRFFVKDGRAPHEPYKLSPVHSVKPSRFLQELTVVANFVEVFLAKRGHHNPVGINYLEKIQMPNLASIYGAMLAGVDYILMGAGIPREIPGILDKFMHHEEASLKIDVKDDEEVGYFSMTFNPTEIMGKLKDSLKRPKFIPIISSAILAITMAKRATGSVEGFIIEGPSAGGHNAPPRGAKDLDENGEPIWGEKDEVDLEKIKQFGLPFWLAGSFGTPEKVQEALALGATGVQIGTPFAFCQESGLRDDIKHWVIRKLASGEVSTFTDPKASPTGFPFKVVQIEGTLSDEGEYDARPRICDAGYLRSPYKGEDGQIHYRCPSEPQEDYLRKGGHIEDTYGRKCLCNGLLANIGMSQLQRTGYLEKPLITAGKNLSVILNFLHEGQLTYSAADVIETLCPQLVTARV